VTLSGVGLRTGIEPPPVAAQPKSRRRSTAAPGPLAPLAELNHGRVGLGVAVALVTVQVIVNYHVGQISDLKSLFFSHHLAHDPVPYVDVRIEYPVLIGLFITAVAAITHGLHGYLVVSSIGLWICAVGTTCALWNVSRRAAWCFALSPLLLVYSLLNWDLEAIFLMALGWLAWTRNRYATAAALMTLGVFTKVYPVFLLFFCAVALVRRRRDGLATTPDLARFCATALVTGAVVNVPFMILAFHNWSYFWSYNSGRTEHADLLSWLGPLEHAPASTANAVLAAVVAVSVVVGVRTIWRRGSPVHVAAVAFFVYIVFQKINSPQYTLWLVVYAAIDEWEPWTIVALSLMGLADYANAVINIELVARHDAGFRHWYGQHFYGTDQGLRLVTTIVALIATVARRDLGWPARRGYDWIRGRQ
jgi:glycosyl transferase family 87